MKSEKQAPLRPPNPPQPSLVREGAGEKRHSSPDETTNHSTKLSKNDSQVAGYDKGRPGGVKGFIPYNKKLTTLARENRKNPTAAEIKMWNEVLRMRHFEKLKFLRQKPIGNYILDFYCAELHLAIEIDGDTHAFTEEYDAARTAALNALGISIVRYTNDEVLNNLEGVYDDTVSRAEQISDGVAGL